MSPISLLIYIMLLSRADKDTLTCYPSIDRISEDCMGLSRAATLKHIEHLETKGFIVTKKRPGKPSEYYMLDFAEWRKEPHY